MQKKCIVFVLTCLLFMGAFTTVNAQLVWTQPFPSVPADLIPAYSAQPREELMTLAEQALGTLGVAAEDVARREDGFFAWIGQEDSGERTTFGCDADCLSYARDTRAPDQTVDAQIALQAATELANALLGGGYAAADARIEPYYDEHGALEPRQVDIVWERRTPQGVAVHGLRTLATYGRGCVTHLTCWDAALTPAVAPTNYACLRAEDALARLNFAIEHIDPAHECTSFDDPRDAIDTLSLVYTSVFSAEGLYTPAWSFVRRDAENNWLKSPVLVDCITGDVWDAHDGRLAGAAER